MLTVTFFVDPGCDNFRIILRGKSGEKVSIEETDLVAVVYMRIGSRRDVKSCLPHRT